MEFSNKLKREFGSSFSRLSVPYFDLIQTKILPRKTWLKNAQMQSSVIKSFKSITSTRALDIVCGQAH